MPRMNLQHRFLVHNLLLVLALGVAGGIYVVRLMALGRTVNVSRSVYAEMRTISNVAVDTGLARGLLSDPANNRQKILAHLDYAIGGLDQFVQVSQGYNGTADAGMKAAYVPINSAAVSAKNRLRQVAVHLRNTPGTIDAAAEQAAVDAAMEDISRAGDSCISFLSTRQQDASGALAKNLVVVIALSIAAVLAAIGLSVLNHRLVMRPMKRLREGVKKITQAQFTGKIAPQDMGPSSEFTELAVDFNNMARELDEFYQRLEEQVRDKSRQLIQSERLASVGFLAAGVAHEINNPLNIISGYAELTGKSLDQATPDLDAATIMQARTNLRIIREEAFRCKDITEKLLSLSRGGSDNREALDLANVVRDVAAMTQGLKPYRDRRLTVKLDSAEPLGVRANLTEMKQVLLNLTINALESVKQVGGEVSIYGSRKNGWIELCVADNGRGMGPEVLPHVFEPFFTARRGVERGTGLGLSITHAIVESHQGRIEAQSDGPGRGARFTVRLPASEG